jgi:hypothetical protein
MFEEANEFYESNEEIQPLRAAIKQSDIENQRAEAVANYLQLPTYLTVDEHIIVVDDEKSLLKASVVLGLASGDDKTKSGYLDVKTVKEVGLDAEWTHSNETVTNNGARILQVPY